jgi:hypothetical protein
MSELFALTSYRVGFELGNVRYITCVLQVNHVDLDDALKQLTPNHHRHGCQHVWEIYLCAVSATHCETVRSGVGFGICHRFLLQLLIGNRDPVSNELELDYDGLTLILACRSKQRAEAARVKLYDIADELVRRAKHSPDYDGRAEIFRKNLHIALHIIDLADIQSVFRFADEITQK